MKATTIIRNLEMVEDVLTPTNQMILILDVGTSHRIVELIGTGIPTRMSTKTTLGETGKIEETEITEPNLDHRNAHATTFALALPQSNDGGAQEVPPDHHHPQRP